MRSIINPKANKKSGKTSVENSSSYDTTRTETNTPQKVREAEEPEAIRQRLEQAKGNKSL